MEKIDIKKGLSSKQVEERFNDGRYNYDDTPKTKTIKEIIKSNFFNYFNFLNLILGISAFVAGIIKDNLLFGLKNCLFMGVIIVNSVISIVEEIMSKRIIDRLSLLSEAKVNVLRDGKKESLSKDQIVLDDILLLSAGDQIVADSVIVDGTIEVNESLITGESNSINKNIDDELLSGSFVVSGNAIVRVIHVGKDNYISKISSEAKKDKKVNSVIMRSFEILLKVLGFLIIPIGILMMISQYKVTNSIPDSLFSTVAALIGMIPEGLVLLTSSVMAVGVFKLYRVNVLVQKLEAIEALARVDVICLDKTGTLTEGRMKVVDWFNYGNYDEEDLEEEIIKYANSCNDTNETMKAIKEYFNGSNEEVTKRIDFSSERKFGALEFNNYSLYLGAPQVLCNSKELDFIDKYVDEYRVIAFAKKSGKLSTKLDDVKVIGFIVLEDVIRPSAKATLEYFKNSNVDVKIISGDDERTVSQIARKVGLDNAEGINIGELTREELITKINDYQVFGRVKPMQKKWIVSYLKSQGHTVAMTGDGVNDVLALRESDCAISVKSGTDAARNVSQLVLLNDDFNSIPQVVKEGRQTINNVERSASLLLVKTIYTILLVIFSIAVPQKYFFIPIQLTFITTVTIGAPSFILALEPNNEQIKGKFLLKILAKSLPAALTVVINIIVVSMFSYLFNIDYETQSTISVLLTAFTGLLYLLKICYPFSVLRGILFFTMTAIFILGAVYIPEFFNLMPINLAIGLMVFVLGMNSVTIFKVLTFIITFIFSKLDKSIEFKKAS